MKTIDDYLKEEFLVAHPETTKDKFDDEYDAWLAGLDIDDLLDKAQKAIEEERAEPMRRFSSYIAELEIDLDTIKRAMLES